MSIALTNSYASPLAAFARKQADIARTDRQGPLVEPSKQPFGQSGVAVPAASLDVAKQGTASAAINGQKSETQNLISKAFDTFFDKLEEKDAARGKPNIAGNIVDNGEEDMTPAERRYQKVLEIKGREKARAREMIVELGKQLKILRKIYETNPKELVKQYTRVLKQLKEAVAIYAKAAGELREAARVLKQSTGVEAGPPTVAAGPAPKSASGEEQAEPELGEGAKHAEADVVAQEKPAGEQEAQGPEVRERAVAAYQQVKLERYRTDKTQEGLLARDDRKFAQEVRGTINKLKEYFHEVKVKAIGMYGSKFLKSETYEEMQDALKEVEEDLDDFQADVERAAPSANWSVRIVA